MQPTATRGSSWLHKLWNRRSVNAEFRVRQDNAITRNIHAIKVKKEAARVVTKWKRFFMFPESFLIFECNCL